MFGGGSPLRPLDRPFLLDAASLASPLAGSEATAGSGSFCGEDGDDVVDDEDEVPSEEDEEDEEDDAEPSEPPAPAAASSASSLSALSCSSSREPESATKQPGTTSSRT